MAWLLSMSGPFPISVRRLPDPGARHVGKYRTPPAIRLRNPSGPDGKTMPDPARADTLYTNVYTSIQVFYVNHNIHAIAGKLGPAT